MQQKILALMIKSAPIDWNKKKHLHWLKQNIAIIGNLHKQIVAIFDKICKTKYTIIDKLYQEKIYNDNR